MTHGVTQPRPHTPVPTTTRPQTRHDVEASCGKVEVEQEVGEGPHLGAKHIHATPPQPALSPSSLTPSMAIGPEWGRRC
jgi:hypothetical protein